MANIMYDTMLVNLSWVNAALHLSSTHSLRSLHFWHYQTRGQIYCLILFCNYCTENCTNFELNGNSCWSKRKKKTHTHTLDEFLSVRAFDVVLLVFIELDLLTLKEWSAQCFAHACSESGEKNAKTQRNRTEQSWMISKKITFAFSRVCSTINLYYV